jgi:hypothetical protein
VDNLAHPEVCSEAPVFEDYLLEVVEFVSFVVVGFQVFEQLFHMLALVHDFGWLLESQGLHHHLGSGTLFNNQKVKNVIMVYFVNQFIYLDISIDVLCTSATGQMDEIVAMSLAILAEIFHDGIDIFLLQETLRSLH